MYAADTFEDWFAWPRGMSDDDERPYWLPLPNKVAANNFEDSGTGDCRSEGDSRARRRGSMVALDPLGGSVCRVIFVHLDATGGFDAPAKSAIWAAVKPVRASMLICAALMPKGVGMGGTSTPPSSLLLHNDPANLRPNFGATCVRIQYGARGATATTVFKLVRLVFAILPLGKFSAGDLGDATRC